MCNFVKSYGILLVLIICLLVLNGCGSKTTDSQTANSAASSERTIVDMSGKSVKIPAEVNKIVVTCYGGASHEIAVLNAGDKIIAQPSMEKFNQLVTMLPKFKDTPDVGSFDNVNVEEVLKLKPDIVVASVTAATGNKKLEEAGIPVVTVLTGKATIDGLKQEFKVMGEVLHKEKEAATLIQLWKSKLQMLQERVAKIPEGQTKKVYYMLGKLTHTEGSANWGQSLITTVGGINAAQEIGNGKDISVEQLLKWDPDAIIVSSNEGQFIKTDDIKNNPQISNLKAVKNNQIYQCPIGSFWWDRPSPESVLGFMWLAKTLYPDTFADINLEQETKDFYQTFYHYPLTDQELKNFFNPQAAQN